MHVLNCKNFDCTHENLPFPSGRNGLKRFDQGSPGIFGRTISIYFSIRLHFARNLGVRLNRLFCLLFWPLREHEGHRHFTTKKYNYRNNCLTYSGPKQIPTEFFQTPTARRLIWISYHLVVLFQSVSGQCQWKKKHKNIIFASTRFQFSYEKFCIVDDKCPVFSETYLFFVNTFLTNLSF